MANFIMMAATKSFQLVCLLGLIAVSSAARASDIFDLLSLEHELLQNFRDYAAELQTKINTISGALAEYHEEISEANEDHELYLSNPLNAFKLVRHMHQDWIHWQIYMGQQVGAAQVDKLEQLLLRTPQRSDLNLVARHVDDISAFYDIAPSLLVTNKEVLSPLNLTALDCHHMGEQLYERRSYHRAAEWLAVAADNYMASPYSNIYELMGVAHWQVYELLSKVFKNLNLRDQANSALQKAIDLAPDNVHLLQQQHELELLSIADGQKPLPVPAARTSDLALACRGPPKFNSDLYCELSSMDTPYLELAPLQLEELLLEPYVLLYHDVIHMREIWHIEDAFDRCPDGAKFLASDGVSGCSISDRYSEVTKRIANRILDMAGIDQPAKELYVLKYGQKEAFKLFDLFKASAKFAQVDFSEIMATVIIFLQDTPVGGAITLHSYNVTVFPRRGNALVTYDEIAFEHTVCPIVVGSGFVLVKFLYMDD